MQRRGPKPRHCNPTRILEELKRADDEIAQWDEVLEEEGNFLETHGGIKYLHPACKARASVIQRRIRLLSLLGSDEGDEEAPGGKPNKYACFRLGIKTLQEARERGFDFTIQEALERDLLVEEQRPLFPEGEHDN